MGTGPRDQKTTGARGGGDPGPPQLHTTHCNILFGPFALVQDPLQTIVDAQYAKLTPARIGQLRAKLLNMHAATGGRLTVATGCSGTDVLLLMLQCLVQKWQEIFGLVFQVEHVFSCDHGPLQQKFIQVHWQPTCLFEEMSEVGGSETAWDVKSESVQPVPSCFLWATGIWMRQVRSARPPQGNCISVFWFISMVDFSSVFLEFVFPSAQGDRPISFAFCSWIGIGRIALGFVHSGCSCMLLFWFSHWCASFHTIHPAGGMSGECSPRPLLPGEGGCLYLAHTH